MTDNKYMCKMCKNPIEPNTLIRIAFVGRLSEEGHDIIDTTQREFIHDDCFEKSDMPFPARRRIIQITEVTPK